MSVVADQELGQEGVTSSGSLEPPAPDVVLRTAVPPYRLGELLLHIGEHKLTGRLSLSTDMGRRAILFHSGFPVFSQSSLFSERLGAIGVRHGFFSRDDVARALQFARDRKAGLGEALLELAYVSPARLFALLGVQLREVVAASCGGEPLRARFQSGGGPLRDVGVLKMHPLTAVLHMVASVPSAEQSRLHQMIGNRKVSRRPLPELAQQWLHDLGFMGDQLVTGQGDVVVSGLRSRLLARYRSEGDQAFIPANVPYAFAGTRAMASQVSPASVADLVALTLLVSGALRLCDPPPPISNRPGEVTSAADALRMALDQAMDRPLAETRPVPPPSEAAPADPAIETYLHAERDRGVAAAAAVWGPNADASDTALPSELLRLYLTLKPEKRSDVVLGVSANATPEQIMDAYARRAEVVASITADAAPSEHLNCRVAELGQRFDDALQMLLAKSQERRSLSPPAAARRGESLIPPPAPVPSLTPAEAAPNGEAVRAAAAAPQNGSSLAGTVTAPVSLRPPVAIPTEAPAAQPASEPRSWPKLVIVALAAMAIGYALRHFGGDPGPLLQ